jgi:DNA-binding NarL/FixJ family response regulator
MLDPVSENQSIRRLLIIEDDRLLRDHLVRATSASPEWSVIAAGNLAAARAQLAKHAIDAVFLDLGLPDGDGLNLISEFRQANPACEILVITVFAEERRVIRSLEAGASGYILKSDLADYAGRLVSIIESGGSPIIPSIARSLINRLRPPPESAENQGLLSQREAEVLQLCSKGLRYAEIAEVLGVSSHTVNTHLKSVYRKLMVHSRAEAVFEARRHGLLND